MPELPEVETLSRQLQKVVAGKKIKEFKVLDQKLGEIAGLVGKKVLCPCRRGKGLQIPLNDGRVIGLHLRMTGRLLWREGEAELLPHTRLRIGFSRGQLDLIDPRRFATLKVQEEGAAPLAEPASGDHLPSPLLWEKGRNRNLPIKSFLMDQRFITGIGNIYACEILFAARLDPRRKTKELSLTDWQKLGRLAKTILTRAIACRGTSVSDWYDLFGQKGEYQYCLQVYGKEGLPCPCCGAAIERFRLGGRGTYMCPVCQK